MTTKFQSLNREKPLCYTQTVAAGQRSCPVSIAQSRKTSLLLPSPLIALRLLRVSIAQSRKTSLLLNHWRQLVDIPKHDVSIAQSRKTSLLRKPLLLEIQ